MASPINSSSALPVSSPLLAAGTYDLVALNPNPNKTCARMVVALAADAGWTITDAAGQVTGPFAVPAGFEHRAHTAAITCASPIAVYY